MFVNNSRSLHQNLQSRQVKRTPKILLMNWLFEKWSVSRSRYKCQIQIGIPACVYVMSSEYFTRTSLHLVRLKIFEWLKLLERHLHQDLGNWAGRYLINCIACEFKAHYARKMQIWIWNLLLPTDSSNNKFIDEIFGGTFDLSWL